MKVKKMRTRSGKELTVTVQPDHQKNPAVSVTANSKLEVNLNNPRAILNPS